MDVGAVCTVVVSAFAARKLIDVLQMIRAGFPCIPDDHLCIPVREPDICCSHRLGHAETSLRLEVILQRLGCAKAETCNRLTRFPTPSLLD
jgi:hypothetical protein